MMPKISDKQRQAIEHRNSNLLVSASAGSGKTFVLTQRILKYLIEDNCSIDQFIILTFTEASAKDMLRKIKNVIEQSLNQTEGETLLHLQRQLQLLSLAPIQTFHSYCLSLINQYGALIDLKLPIKISDSGQIVKVKKIAMKSTFEKFASDSEFLEFLFNHSGVFEFESFFNLIDKLYNKLLAYDNYENILANSFKIFKESFQENLEYQSLFLQYRQSHIIQAREMIVSELELLQLEGQFDLHIEYYRELLQQLDSINMNTLKPIIFHNFDLKQRLTYPKDSVDCDQEALVKKSRKKISDLITGVINLDAQTYYESMICLESDVKYYVEFIIAFKQEFEQLKKDHELYEFSDLETLALKILDDQDICDYIKQNTVEIMVDEYQDTNEIQETLVNKIANNNVFMVGDLKQSIYGFRNANPSLFIDKQSRYQNQSGGKLVVLNQNFRSSKSVLAYTNYIMERLMDRQLGNIEYDDINRLYPGTIEYPEHDHHFIQVFENDEDEVIASFCLQVAKLIKNGAKKSDIAILTRKKTLHKKIQQALLKLNIESFIENSNGFYDSTEIMAVLSLLRVINRSNNPIDYLAVLKSPYFELNESQLLDISKLIDMKQIEKSIFESSNAILQEFAKMILAFRELKNLPLSHLVSHVIYYGEFFAKITKLNNAQQRISNLEFLVEKAFEMESQNNLYLSSLLDAIDQMISDNVEVYQANTVLEDQDVVRIMTIHKSKGLEYEHVIVYLDKTFNLKDTQQNAIFNEKFGIVSQIINSKQGYYKQKTLLFEMLKYQEKLNVLAEEMRILYVALTRAKLSISLIVQSGEQIEPALVQTPVIPYSNRLNGSGFRGWYLEIFKQFLLEQDLPFKLNYQIHEPIDLINTQEVIENEKEIVNQIIIPPISNNQQFSSVTKLKQGDNVIVDKAVLVGTLYHNIMQLIDILEMNKSEFNDFIEHLKELDVLDFVEKYNLNLDAMYSFCKLNIFNDSSIVNLEKEIPISFIKDEINVQGIIDLLVEFDNKFMIIDYKSDLKTEQQLIEMYDKQLMLYRDGLTGIVEKPIECYIYSFHLKKLILI